MPSVQEAEWKEERLKRTPARAEGCEGGLELTSTDNCSKIFVRSEPLTNPTATFFRDSDRGSKISGDALYATAGERRITDEKSITR